MKPRYLIRVCSGCKRELGRKPLPKDYPKTSVLWLDKGDLISHGICPTCGPKLYGNLWSDNHEPK